MANYQTQFSVLLPLQTAENVQRAIEIAGDLSLWHPDYDPDEGEDLLYVGFNADEQSTDPTQLWISDTGDEGDAGHVIAYVLHLAETLNLTGKWGFTYANTCSKPRLDAFSGGAVVLDLDKREVEISISAGDLLQERLGD